MCLSALIQKLGSDLMNLMNYYNKYSKLILDFFSQDLFFCLSSCLQ